MPIIKSLPRAERGELIDHRDNTAKEMIKCYSLRQLSFMDGVDTRTIKTSGRYLPVRLDTGEATSRFKRGITKKTYMVRYIRLDEIKFIFSKRNKGKKLTIE